MITSSLYGNHGSLPARPSSEQKVATFFKFLILSAFSICLRVENFLWCFRALREHVFKGSILQFVMCSRYTLKGDADLHLKHLNFSSLQIAKRNRIPKVCIRSGNGAVDVGKYITFWRKCTRRQCDWISGRPFMLLNWRLQENT